MKKTTNLLQILPVIFSLLYVSGCSKEKEDVVISPPIVTTAAVDEVTANTAVCGGTITSDGNDEITGRGVCWSRSPTPTINNDKTRDGTGSGDFTSSITGLYGNTTYYVRAYAINSASVGYGNDISFTTEEEITEPVADIDGNIYNTVAIGSQVWIAENLKVTHFRNGDPIPDITDDTEWENNTTGAYCNYNNNTTLADIYGRLYKWEAVDDSRNISPVGWHVASANEWRTLVDFLGGEEVAGGKMKQTGSSWVSPNTGATNESGFSALPGGCRRHDGDYIWIGEIAKFWSSTHSYDDNAYSFTLYSGDSQISEGNGGTGGFGFSVRCVKD